MTFGSPLLLLTLLLVPLALAAYWLTERRRARYAVRYTNVDVLALVAAGRRPWRRWVATGIFLLTIAVLCTAVARPRVSTMVPSDKATIVLVLDVSGSMQAIDVKPTRLIAAQNAMQTFLKKVPKRVRVGLVLFAGEAQVATPPTTDHDLVSQAIDDAGAFHGFGGTAIGDALNTAVQLGRRTVGPAGRTLAAYVAAPRKGPSSTLVTILFLSDGHQTQGILTPRQGAMRAKAAGFPVYTVALGTTGATRLRGFPSGAGGFFNPNSPGAGGFGGFGRRALSPDPKTLRAIADLTGGEFFRAKSAGSAEATYAKLGTSLGRTPGRVEVTDKFLVGGALLLVLSLGLAAWWAPRIP